MSVWISDEKLLIFASLISPSKMILFEKKYQTFDTVFHHQMKHLEVRQQYSAARRIFNSLLGVSCLIYYIEYILSLLTKKQKKSIFAASSCKWRMRELVVNLHSNLSKMFSTPGDLMEAIKRVLCSFENYKERFNTASVAVQGSGWGWLVSHAFFF